MFWVDDGRPRFMRAGMGRSKRRILARACTIKPMGGGRTPIDGRLRRQPPVGLPFSSFRGTLLIGS